ncbi:hypothetical protein Tco_1035161 [Tanacetum coccineum]
MDQYLALIQDNIRPGIVKPEISDDVKFEINGNFMRELRRKLFKGTDEEYSYKHLRRVLEIADLFHFPGVTHDAVMLRVFPITLMGPTLRWKNRLSAGYNDLLFRCPQHKSELLSEAQALKLIQVMADHSHNWYDGETTRENINDSSDNVDTKKLKENIHAIQDKAVEPSKYIGSLEETIIKYYDESIKKQATNDEWIRKFIENMDLNLRALDTTIKNLQVKADQLTRMVLTNAGERVKAEMKMGKKDMKEPVPYDLPVVQPYVPPTPFPGHLKKQNDNPYKTRETVCTIGIPEKIHKKELRRMKGIRMMVGTL